MEENYFKQLYDIDVRSKTKQKNGLNYLSWAAAWAEAKKAFPDATYKVYEDQIVQTDTTYGGVDENGAIKSDRTISRTIYRPWFDDGNTGWVKTSVTINDIEYIDRLPVMNYKNQPIPASSITSSDANKSVQRSLTRALARHGIGLYIYEGEDLPEEMREVTTLQSECMELIKKKCALSEKTKTKVGEVCKEELGNESGDPTVCEDSDTLKSLKKKLMAIRKL